MAVLDLRAVIREDNLFYCNYNQIFSCRISILERKKERDKQERERDRRKDKRSKKEKEGPLLLHELRKTLHYEDHCLKIDHDQYFLRPPPTQLFIARTRGCRHDFCRGRAGWGR
jgi:hypothetical protein